MKKFLLVLLAVVALLAGMLIGMGIFQQQEVSLDPGSERNLLQGKVVGFTDKHNTHAWLGIPFAQPPVAELRWKAPRKAGAWQGTRQATGFGDYCMQISSPAVTMNMTEWGEVAGSEDCLYLNVWAPQFKPEYVPAGSEKLPVMLWIHGGGNATGTAATYDFSRLSGDQKVIVVSISYRLGLFGWFTHPSLRAEAENPLDASGNFGLLDMIESLKWVKNNIAAFGGDPDRVTIFGESAGGFNVVALLASPQAKGLFHRAIVQSGGVDVVSFAEAENYQDAKEPGLASSSSETLVKLLVGDAKASDRETARQLLAQMSDQQILDYLYSKSAGELFSLYDVIAMGMYNSPKMFRDGTVLPDMELLDWFSKPGAYNAVPTITGTNRDEVKLFLSFDENMASSWFGLIKSVVDIESYERHSRYRTDVWAVNAVVDLANSMTSSGSNVWAYRFDWDEGGDTWMGNAAEIYGAAHALEIPFMMGTWDGLTFPGVFTPENLPGREILSQQMMDYWGSFAATGEPGKGKNLPQWNTWQDGQFMVFDTVTDGGVRMQQNQLSVAELKARLASDSSIGENRERCLLYVQMFNYGPNFDDLEYRNLGCEAFDPDNFPVF